jgi:hypothetical protein
MAEEYTWKITLSDDSVKREALGDQYQISWESTNAVKKLELEGSVVMSVTMASSEFNVNGTLTTPTETSGDKKMIFRKRRQIRTDGTVILESRTKYMIGYEVGGKKFTAAVQPPTGMVPVEIDQPKQE